MLTTPFLQIPSLLLGVPFGSHSHPAITL
uniref:Uncharacterized protein n=1 Tax=Anguilla anguilla TaxID=7936 RepID=A0A0E9QL78_ANGAN